MATNAAVLPPETGVKELRTVDAKAVVMTDDGSASMFERLARDPSVDVEKLERLIGMHERIMAHKAKAAFDGAFADMQGDIPVVLERGQTNNGKYAPLEDIVAAVRPILQQYGFSLSHRTEWPDPKTVKVIGVLTHREGYERTSEFLSNADSSGSKNAIQGLGSAISYGRRYTTNDLLNITTRAQDDDGARVGRQDAPAPDKYDEWFLDLETAADAGWDAYRAFWNGSKKEYRAYLTQTAPAVANRLQLKAKGSK